MSVSRLVPLAALIAAFAAPLAADAQTAPPAPPPPPAGAPAPMPGHHHHHHKPSIFHALRSVKNITPAQQQQIAGFRAQEEKANAGADPETKKANAAKMRDRIRGVLSADQRTQLDAEMHRGRGPMQGDGAMPGDGGPDHPMANPPPSPGSN